MNILYSGDKNIADGLILSLLSLTEHCTEPLRVYVLTMNYKDDDRVCEALPDSFAYFLNEFLRKKNPESFLKLYDVSARFGREVPSANIKTRFTLGCMLRLFADEVEDIPSKILYLDNDVLCRGDISEMYNTDITDFELAGVPDYYGRWFFSRKPFKFDYLNSGVLLLNMDKIRSTGLFKKSRELCCEKQMFMPDQSALNKLCAEKKILPRKYNEQRKLKTDSVLQHFTTSFRFFPYIHTVTVKPWHIDKLHNVLGLYCYDELFEKYMQLKKEYTKAIEDYKEAVI